MTIDEIIELISTSKKKTLTSLQEQVLRQAWQGKTYAQIAQHLHYQEAYIKNIASQLWQDLSQICNESITKTNFVSKLKQCAFSKTNPTPLKTMITPLLELCPLEFPTGPVHLTSPLYVERPPIEKQIFAELHKEGSLIRIKAPAKMGKSSLLIRIIDYANSLGYYTVEIDLKEADRSILKNFDKFLRWFSAKINQSLDINASVKEHWDSDLGSSLNCTYYLQRQILEKLEYPLVITIHELEHIFEYQETAQDFLSSLRFWHERARQCPLWAKLRLVVVHSTEIYVPLQLSQSPFNVGLPINLPEFTFSQVRDLALRHGLPWQNPEGEEKIRSLMKMVGGHPYLIRLAFYHLVNSIPQDLTQLLNYAPTPMGIYQNHLHNLLAILSRQPQLTGALRQVINNFHPVQLEAISLHKLTSLGLVKLFGNQVVPSCELYRLYFQQQLLNPKNQELEELKKENEILRQLSTRDDLTKINNRRRFDEELKKEWRRLARKLMPLALIICDVDFFKKYNDNFGHLAGDFCLQRIAQAIGSCVHRPSDLVARYGGEEFAVILPETDATGAIIVAEKIRKTIKGLAIPQKPEKESQNSIITLSLGVACTIPKSQDSINILVEAADQALFKSKAQGRDRVTLSSSLNFRL